MYTLNPLSVIIKSSESGIILASATLCYTAAPPPAPPLLAPYHRRSWLHFSHCDNVTSVYFYHHWQYSEAPTIFISSWKILLLSSHFAPTIRIRGSPLRLGLISVEAVARWAHWSLATIVIWNNSYIDHYTIWNLKCNMLFTLVLSKSVSARCVP